MKNRYTVIRFNAEEEPIATADFETREQADDEYAEFVKCGGKSGGVQLLSPRGFVIKRIEYKTRSHHG